VDLGAVVVLSTDTRCARCASTIRAGALGRWGGITYRCAGDAEELCHFLAPSLAEPARAVKGNPRPAIVRGLESPWVEERRVRLRKR